MWPIARYRCSTCSRFRRPIWSVAHASCAIVWSPGYHDARGQQEQYVALKQPAVKKIEEAAAPKAETVKRSSSKLSYKLQRELEQLPQLLEDLEAKLEALQTQVADASFSSQPHEQTQKVLADMAAAEQELEQAFERWEYLEALKNGG